MPPDNRDDDLRRKILALVEEVNELAREHERKAAEHEALRIENEAKAAELWAEADRLMPGAGGLGRAGDLPRALTRAEYSLHNRVKMSDTAAPPPALGTVRPNRGRPSTTGHPFMVALQAAGLTLTRWADEHKVSRATVKGWVASVDGGGARRIPRAWAETIEKELAVPAILASWPQGIS